MNVLGWYELSVLGRVGVTVMGFSYHRGWYGLYGVCGWNRI